MCSIRVFPAIALVMLLTTPSRADLIGTSVNGSLFFNGSTTGEYDTTVNYFDPANGLVPPGFGNSTSTTVTIGSGIEFAFLQGGGTVDDPGIDSITADFTGSTLTIAEAINYSGPLTGFQIVFTDPAFSALAVEKTSDDFANGGFSGSLVGDTLTLSVGPSCTSTTGCSNWGDGGAATWSFSGTLDTPEPSTWAMMGIGFVGVGFLGRRSRKTAARAA